MFVQKIVCRILPHWLLLILGHVKVHGRLPNIIYPKSMSEKILCRNLFDRRPILTTIADKAEVRKYVADRLGSDVLPEMYYLTDDPDTIPFDDLPVKFVVKPTHGSGWVRVVKNKATLDRTELIATCKDWLSRSYSKEAFESVYKNIQPRIMIEQYIDDGRNLVPADYKLFVFHGKVHVIELIIGRMSNGMIESALFTSDWQRLLVKGFMSSYFNFRKKPKDFQPIDYDVPRPPHLASMIKAAEILGNEWDFIRADFYDTSEKFYFGEITLTPAAGRERFEPVEHDYHLGSLW